MKCEVCGQGPMHGVTIHRTAPKGQAPRWRCEMHMTAEQHAAVPAEVADLVAIVERADAGREHG